MAQKPVETNLETTNTPSGMNRRDAVKRGVMVTGAVGAAWTAPMVYDSFASPASAAGTCPEPIAEVGPVSGQLRVPEGCRVEFELIGGGGGGGGQNSYCGGSGMKVTGTIAPKAGGYTLNWQAAGGGGGGGSYGGTTPRSLGGTAGAGYKLGGAGGTVTGTYSAGGGGGGGGGSAIYSGSNVYVYAPGGGGSGGGQELNASVGRGHGNPPASLTAFNIAGANDSDARSGKGGSTTGAAAAAGGHYGGGTTPTAGTTSGGGRGGGGNVNGCTGGGGGGGGYGGGGGGGGEDINGKVYDPGGSGGNGSAVAAAAAGFSFLVAPRGIAADTAASNARTSGLAADAPGRSGDGTSTPASSSNGGPGGPGSVKLTFIHVP